MSSELTREMLDKTLKSAMASFDEPYQQTPIYCSSLEAPFFCAIFNDGKDLDTVLRLKYECFRKYRMGEKRNIEKWSRANLIRQYEERLSKMSKTTTPLYGVFVPR